MRRRSKKNWRLRTSHSITSVARGCSTTLRRRSQLTAVTEDDLAFGRDCRAFTNLLINELPRGDFAFTMVRQFFVDAFNVPFLTGLARSKILDLPRSRRRP